VYVSVYFYYFLGRDLLDTIAITCLCVFCIEFQANDDSDCNINEYECLQVAHR